MPTKFTCFLAVVVVAVLSSGTARTDDMIMTTGLRQDEGAATSVNLSTISCGSAPLRETLV
jgi:hypothetical protein